jgi:hypothetical protein
VNDVLLFFVKSKVEMVVGKRAYPSPFPHFRHSMTFDMSINNLERFIPLPIFVVKLKG